MGGWKDIFPFTTKTNILSDIKENPLAYFLLNSCNSIWGKLYRTTLFNDYYVPNSNFGEDAIVNVQVFSKIKLDKLQKINHVIYNYYRCTISVTRDNCKKHYSFYNKYPDIACRLWIEKYIERIDADNTVKSAFVHYMLEKGIIPYLRYNKLVNKNDPLFFHSQYYKKDIYRKRIKFTDRIVVPIFTISIELGKIYVSLLNSLSRLKNSIHNNYQEKG
jgi:hypothetical protein